MIRKYRSWIVLLVLSVGGGAIYLLPYLRYSYYDSIIIAFGISHTEAGLLMSVYGFANIISYLIGGILADRIQARTLISFSMYGSGALGLYYATFPGFSGALIVHLLWSITTIMTFWAPMVKTIRLLGDDTVQGRLFGFKETGFAAFALIYSALALIPYNLASGNSGVEGLQMVILIYSSVLILSGTLSVFFIPLLEIENTKTAVHLNHGLYRELFRRPELWLAASIIFCAYSLHSGMSFFIPYFTDAFGMSLGAAAMIGVIRTYGINMIGGPLGGFIVDSIGSSTKYLSITFALVSLFIAVFMVVPGDTYFLPVIISVMIVSTLGISSMRGVYFVPLAELKIQERHLGFAAGFLSLIGFLPDVVLYTLFGYLMDVYPGDAGYKLIFSILTLLAFLGIITSLILFRKIHRSHF